MTDSDTEDDKPPRKRRVVKKKPPVMKSKKTNDQDDAFKKKIKEAIQINLSEYAEKKNLSQKQVSVINSFIEEHLSCFVLIGYNEAGDPISIVNAKTPKDSDSLGTLLQKFLMKYVDPPPYPGGGGPSSPLF